MFSGTEATQGSLSFSFCLMLRLAQSFPSRFPSRDSSCSPARQTGAASKHAKWQEPDPGNASYGTDTHADLGYDIPTLTSVTTVTELPRELVSHSLPTLTGDGDKLWLATL